MPYKQNYAEQENTQYWTLNPECPAMHLIHKAAALIREGRLVAFPTETVYGLGANALDSRAVERIFAAKGRPADNPLIVHVASQEQLAGLVKDVPAAAHKLIDKFWPGPLTLVLVQAPAVPLAVTAGLGTVAVRMPAHPVALALIEEAGVPVAAPSANYSGRPSPTTAAHVREDLHGRIAAILDAGSVPLGLESTVLDLTLSPPTILRPGAIGAAALSALIGEVADHSDLRVDRPLAPGMKYRHYAPRAPLWLYEGPVRETVRLISDTAAEKHARGQKVVIIAREETASFYQKYRVIVSGRQTDPDSVAASLYDSLRQADQAGADLILAEGLSATGVGHAVMNRLRKAASRVLKAGDLK